jgi:hypothetical protein
VGYAAEMDDVTPIPTMQMIDDGREYTEGAFLQITADRFIERVPQLSARKPYATPLGALTTFGRMVKNSLVPSPSTMPTLKWAIGANTRLR